MKMYGSPDRTAFVLNQPMAGSPGTSFNYNGGNPYLLSALINRKSGQNAFDFAKKELFEPLGIKSAKWGAVDAQGVTDGEAGLFLSPHDMAKIGYLYLHNGRWDGKQIIPPSWVDRTKAGGVTATFGFNYANLWWSYPEKGAYMARGRHSQLILVIPKHDVIVVMTGVLRDNEFYAVSGLIDDISSAQIRYGAARRRLQKLCWRRRYARRRRKAIRRGRRPNSPRPFRGRLISSMTMRCTSKNFTLNFLRSDSSWVINTYPGQADPLPRTIHGVDGSLMASFAKALRRHTGSTPPGDAGSMNAHLRWSAGFGRGEIQTGCWLRGRQGNSEL